MTNEAKKMTVSALLFWKNPEFLRHRRSELRKGRAITVLAVVLVICALIWLGNWGSQQQANRRDRIAQQFRIHREQFAAI